MKITNQQKNTNNIIANAIIKSVTKKDKDVSLKVLKVIVLASLMEDAIDDVRETHLYQKNIKNQCNKMVKMLEPHVAEVDVIYSKGPEFTTNVMREVDELTTKMADLNVVDYVMMKQIYDTYSNDKENWQNLMNIEFQKLQD